MPFKVFVNFQLPSELLKDLNIKFRPTFNHGFANHEHCTIVKALYNFMVKRMHEARDNQFLFENVPSEIF